MKLLQFIIILFAFSSLNGLALSTQIKAQSKSHKKEITPPGTVLFEEGLYVDKTEISNFNWLEYMYWTKRTHGDSSEQYSAVLLDTMVWRKSKTLYEAHYLKHPSYQNYPIVGVSYEQAVAFCIWRSDRVNEFIFAQNKNNKVKYQAYRKNPESVQIPIICTYRLPTEKEWESFAAVPFSKKSIRKYKKWGTKYNISGERKTIQTEDDSLLTYPIHSLWPNTYGMYHLSGNVAEMVAEKGISKGGSWFHKIEDSKLDAVIKYDNVNNWLGFRCVCEVNQ